MFLPPKYSKFIKHWHTFKFLSLNSCKVDLKKKKTFFIIVNVQFSTPMRIQNKILVQKILFKVDYSKIICVCT